jgi:hypothetical protein
MATYTKIKAMTDPLIMGNSAAAKERPIRNRGRLSRARHAVATATKRIAAASHSSHIIA